MSKYTYKYTPNGKNAEKITAWLKNQPNKAESLNLLILQAERKYGNRDIVDMTTQAFLNDEIGKVPTSETKSLAAQVIESATPKNQQSETDTKKSTYHEDAQPVTTSQVKKEPENKKPNLGFLSNK
jgi:hypothetical protein